MNIAEFGVYYSYLCKNLYFYAEKFAHYKKYG